uniref:Uncharacterized protein n=1 Tax=Anguilla anguilla TaxID=7936 RepID=A0A0E9VRX6_ANGAN
MTGNMRGGVLLQQRDLRSN